MLKIANYQHSEKAQTFLDSVENGKYDRQIINGLKKFFDGQAPEDMRSFYSPDELKALADLKGTKKDVEARMPVKLTRHYFDLAKKSDALKVLVKASPQETQDLKGAPDPGKQMSYSPVEGLIHKYEMGLLYVVSTCSAHCRFCYREELIARKKIKRPDGTVAPKGLAQIGPIVAYIKKHNAEVTANGGRHPETGREKLREILMSGGDPMVLSNKKIAAWWAALAEAGIESIRLGTKDLAFYPKRFDKFFFDMADKFHAAYPGTKIRLMIHFNHPDEFLLKDENGNYFEDSNGSLVWHPDTKGVIEELGKRNWLAVDNQAPIIANINNNPDALRIMQRELKQNKVENHYFFCGRDIIGHRAFNVPIEEAWHVLNESQKGLSGVETHARLSITHYKGKTEVVAVTNDPLPGVSGAENGFVIMKLHRNSEDAPEKGLVTILGRNPEAIWFSGYNDRVIYDEAGLYTDLDNV
jgi:L-lysine 2,3-aminomutase